MALTYNGVTVNAINYNGNPLNTLTYNGVTVWTVPITAVKRLKFNVTVSALGESGALDMTVRFYQSQANGVKIIHGGIEEYIDYAGWVERSYEYTSTISNDVFELIGVSGDFELGDDPQGSIYFSCITVFIVGSATHCITLENIDNFDSLPDYCFDSYKTYYTGEKAFILSIDGLVIDNVNSIGSYCFQGFDNGTRTSGVTIPATVTSIGSSAFSFIYYTSLINKFRFLHSASQVIDTSVFNFNLQKGSGSKQYLTYDIYTDNATIKDICIAQRADYTTITVYHLDGTEWE